MSTTSSPRTLSTERSLLTPATLATGTPPYPAAGSLAGAPGTMTGTTIAAARRTGRPWRTTATCAGGQMPNPFVKLWKYLTASANAKIDEKADPKIQIAQAIEAEQQRHQALANQAAAVLGNQRQLEMRLNRQRSEEHTSELQ